MPLNLKRIFSKKELIEEDDFEDFESQYTGCYVYELFVKATGEIFYVGYDSNEQRDEPLDCSSPLYIGFADLISKHLETGKRILKTGLREAVADHYVRKRIKEISSHNMLCTRENASYPNPSQIGVAPKFEVCPLEQYYLGMEAKPFDKVDISNLTTVHLYTGFLSKEKICGLYGDHYAEYYDELKRKLEAIGSKIVKGQYAKSVKAWIYLSASIVYYHDKDQESALQKLGRNIPTYHIFDVLEALKDVSAEPIIDSTILDVEINPIHNRCPWRSIRNLNDWKTAYAEGSDFFRKGETLRLQGDIEGAIFYLDQARECGLDVVYDSYEKAYRKIKDYDNEIDILMECYERNKEIHGNDRAWDDFFVRTEEKINKAKKRLIQSRKK